MIAALCWLTIHAYAGTPFNGIVNINTATADELQQLPGVGPSKAKRILDHRARRPFRTVAELVRVKGFGAKTLTRLRPFLTVSGPSTNAAAANAASASCPCTCNEGKVAQAVPDPKPQARVAH